MVPSACTCVSLHRLIASASRRSSSPKCSTTCIRFRVRVPVLSEQITCVQPSVSTAVSCRMTALRFAMRVTPIASCTVTTAARPSGIAATARETASMKVSNKDSARKSPLRNSSNRNIKAQIAKTRRLSSLESRFSFCCRGVASSLLIRIASAIFPISVCIPVAVITARPLPYTTLLPI